MAVEAQSLAYITNIASNPPLYPRNPAEQNHDSITLYIVRVPGSRDVFLTPLKPKEKVVNAQDVTSSLYFLHVDEVSDTDVRDLDQYQQWDSTDSAFSTKRLSSASTISRKPLPTPPESPDDGSFPFAPAPLPVYQDNLLRVPTRKPVLPARSPLRTSPDRRPSEDSHHYRRLSNESRPTTGTSLTLIRRDPTSGAQWNVAKIRDPPIEDISSEMLTSSAGNVSRTKTAGAPLYLEIQNPGYTRFNHQDQSVARSQVSDAASSYGSVSSNVHSPTTFSRRMWMDGSRFGDHSYIRRKLPSADTSAAASRASTIVSPNTLPLVDKRSKGYAFTSPWGGKCEFATSTAGRSLKCRHNVESTASHTESSVEISELRFNLPTRRPSLSVDLGTASNRSSYYGHRHARSEPANEAEPDWTTVRDENGDIDYSLGRERAGGGFGGKQAKLGKLIVADEGQKMLDLVVAANLALWWRAYERTS